MFIFLWLVIMSHEVIPHYHPEGDAHKTNIIKGNGENNNERNNDENGVLDNLEIILCKPQGYIHPSFNYSSIFNFNGLLDVNLFLFPDLIAYLKYFNTKSPPNYLNIFCVSLLRAPPFYCKISINGIL